MYLSYMGVIFDLNDRVALERRGTGDFDCLTFDSRFLRKNGFDRTNGFPYCFECLKLIHFEKIIRIFEILDDMIESITEKKGRCIYGG